LGQGEQGVKHAFGRRVRELRKRLGMSQEALALTCELDRTYIGGVERGERNISLVNIHRIAAALGVQASTLLSPATRSSSKKAR
jgi:transcriptional regulator with XRE-family HTH domain